MMNENNYSLSVTRLEICDLMMACTNIVLESREEMRSPDCPEYRKSHVLPGTIEKWQSLHDKLEKQLNAQDAGSVFDELLEHFRAGEITREEVKSEMAFRVGFLF